MSFSRIACAFSCVVLAACAAPAGATEPTIVLQSGTSTLRAEVGPPRSSTGNVYCALFNAAEGFPGASPIVGGSRVVVARSGDVVECEFTGLPEGDYGVSVFHDENSNALLDADVFGAPTEGYGATNNALPAAAAPRWEENHTHLAAGQSASVRVQLRY